MKGMRVRKFLTRTREQFALAGPALRAWTPRQWAVAAATAIRGTLSSPSDLVDTAAQLSA